MNKKQELLQAKKDALEKLKNEYSNQEATWEKVTALDIQIAEVNDHFVSVQSDRNKSQEECYDDYHHRCINKNIYIIICIQFHIFLSSLLFSCTIQSLVDVALYEEVVDQRSK